MTKIEKRFWGWTSDGSCIDLYTMRNSSGSSVEIITLGAALRAWYVPMKDGSTRDIVLGCDSVSDYEQQGAYLGATVGRVANRIKNGTFVLDDRVYTVTVNDSPNCNHGGSKGFDKQIWQGTVEREKLTLFYRSRDGEEGFPGCLQVWTTYQLEEDQSLHISWRAETDQTTILNLTNHSYFNLHGGQAARTILDHRLQIFADQFTENDENGLTTGEICHVEGTPYDFRVCASIGKRMEIGQLSDSCLGGFDKNYIIKSANCPKLITAAIMEAEGLRLTCITNQPGLHLYTGNFLTGERGKDGAPYDKYAGICLEAQNWPDAIHHSCFPSMIIRPGEVYQREVIYKIGDMA